MADIRFSVHLQYTSGSGPKDVDWETPVLATQAANDVGVAELLEAIVQHRAALGEAGALDARRRARRRAELEALLVEELTAQVMARVHADPDLAHTLAVVSDGSLDPYSAVTRILSSLLARPVVPQK
jgi:LAO/AO transport system kinase